MAVWTFRHHASKTFRFSPFLIIFITFFLKTRDLQGEVHKGIWKIQLTSLIKHNEDLRGNGGVAPRINISH